MATRHWLWRKETQPFSGLTDDERCARFVVEQIDDDRFCIATDHGFRYTADGQESITVDHDTLPSTDFASIPRYMAWLVSRHGRHTPAALVHDQLVTPRMGFRQRRQADELFLRMMDDLEVAPVQSRLMWTAVTLATRAKGTVFTKLGLAAWALAGLVGITALGLGIAHSVPWLVAAALAGPTVASLLWGRQYRAGLIAGYALPLVATPALVCLLGYWIYWLVEQTTKTVRQQLPHNKHADLPTPIGYQGR